MAEYIEREAAIREIRATEGEQLLSRKATRSMIDRINSLPAANVRENVTGEWIWTETGSEDYEQFWVCSACGDYDYYRPNFCPNCGASMRDVPDANVVKSHGDEIRAMSDDELAKFIAGKKGTCPRGSECIPRYDGWECEDCWLDWLRQEVTE